MSVLLPVLVLSVFSKTTIQRSKLSVGVCVVAGVGVVSVGILALKDVGILV